MRPAHKLSVLFVRNHHDPFFTLAHDALWPLGPRPSKHLAEAGLSSLDLPGLAGNLHVPAIGGCDSTPRFFHILGHRLPQYSLTSQTILLPECLCQITCSDPQGHDDVAISAFAVR